VLAQQRQRVGGLAGLGDGANEGDAVLGDHLHRVRLGPFQLAGAPGMRLVRLSGAIQATQDVGRRRHPALFRNAGRGDPTATPGQRGGEIARPHPFAGHTGRAGLPGGAGVAHLVQPWPQRLHVGNTGLAEQIAHPEAHRVVRNRLQAAAQDGQRIGVALAGLQSHGVLFDSRQAFLRRGTTIAAECRRFGERADERGPLRRTLRRRQVDPCGGEVPGERAEIVGVGCRVVAESRENGFRIGHGNLAGDLPGGGGRDGGRGRRRFGNPLDR